MRIACPHLSFDGFDHYAENARQNPWFQKAKKQFFFEKKNQKTFARLGPDCRNGRAPEGTKVFCFFFSKKKYFLSSLRWDVTTAYRRRKHHPHHRAIHALGQ
jgi:hypothetical protein